MKKRGEAKGKRDDANILRLTKSMADEQICRSCQEFLMKEDGKIIVSTF